MSDGTLGEQARLAGRLVMAQHLRHEHGAAEIMLRVEESSGSGTTWFAIYLDGREVDRVQAKHGVRDGIASRAHAAYDRMDEIAGYRLADDHMFDIEASMSR